MGGSHPPDRGCTSADDRDPRKPARMHLEPVEAMVTEQGFVEKAASRKALIRVQRNEACSRCQTRGACEMLSEKTMRVEVVNDLGAKEGDRVEISVPTGSFLKLSILVYLLPVVALVGGAYGGSLWAEAQGNDGTAYSVLSGGIAMGIAFFALRRLERSAASPSSDYQPRMTRILPSESPPPCDDSK